MHQHWWVVLLQDNGVQTHSDEGQCFDAAATVGGGAAAAIAVDITSGSGGDEGMG